MIDKIKRDTESNWAKAVNFIPKENEVIIYDCLNDIKIKIGDGVTKVKDLAFVQQERFNFDRVEDETIIVK